MSSKKILFVVTSHGTIGDHKTGLWLEEFAVPYNEFKKQGYEIKVASIAGGDVPLVPNSLEGDTGQFEEAKALLKDTPPLTRDDAHGFDAIFLPGGHGTVFDFPNSHDLQVVVCQFAEDDKVIGSVCHGPSGLVMAACANGAPIVKGKKVSAFTDSEEAEMNLTEEVPFLLETRLRELGAEFVKGENWADFAVADGKLVTGQNPQSSLSVAKKVIEVLEA
ncbi:Putative intracellular protease/amidase [Fictibacillus enclensis]|uniref:Glutamine amidotransferase n=1 Tax=Fictibacillus enclensis TaxID=1017270 RepID=A0A0V8JB79_9BACL|nr:type 1 glutamine amidotransferase domain-containing protein [Fictibacillus enclensis]KSU84253.1 glutamine amidotransferase [Fictibacillus enclensis]SCB75858.1 Putative intracellular protease/amidase [Fictibacillus enclensis]